MDQVLAEILDGAPSTPLPNGIVAPSVSASVSLAGKELSGTLTFYHDKNSRPRRSLYSLFVPDPIIPNQFTEYLINPDNVQSVNRTHTTP